MNLRLPSGLSARRGVTFLELMVVVVIMGVVGSMSMGRFHTLMVQQRIGRAASVVRNDLEAAFTIATRNRRPVRISWDEETMQLAITDRADSRHYRSTNLGKDPYGLTDGMVTASRSPVEVYPNGLANDALIITFIANGEKKEVRMSRAGLVEIRLVKIP
ncbi:MAG TPA: prepilin-type N-terminal cleavage/methylation domain-containing protein [Gemmatimonadaceae bacterium]